MKFYPILISIIFTHNSCLCELIFKDDFNDIILNNWNVVNEKAKCKEIAEEFPQKQHSCNTLNEVNSRTVSGKLAITARRENYFNKKFTTAAIFGKETYNLRPGVSSTLFKIRASLPIVKGLIPRIYLSNTVQYINILNYNEYLWNGLNNKEKITNLTKGTNFKDFNEYEMIFYNNTFIWRLNGIELVRKTINESNPTQDMNNFFYKDKDTITYTALKLIMTVSVDRDMFELQDDDNDDDSFDDIIGAEESVTGLVDEDLQDKDQTNETLAEEYCDSFIIDYIEIYNYNPLEIHTNIMETTESIIDICQEINNLNEESYEKFTPNDKLNLVFREDFNGTNLDKGNWVNLGNDEECKIPPGKQPKSCDPPHGRNINVIGGKLKLFAKNEKYFNHNFTGATISSSESYKNARIEIYAKLATGPGYESELFMRTFEDGVLKGRLYIIKNMGCKTCFFAGFNANEYNVRGNYFLGVDVDVNDYHTYGIEWSKTYVQWFMDDRVVYQVNRVHDVNGRSITTDWEDPWLLPFEHHFSLLLRIGVNYRYNKEYLTDSSPVLEIDYVKVYGEIKEDLFREPYPLKEETGSIPLPIIVAICGVMFIMMVLLIIFVMLWKKQKKQVDQVKNIDLYDDNNFKDDTYDDLNNMEVYEEPIYDENKPEYFEIEYCGKHNYLEIKE